MMELPSPALRAIWSRQARETPRASERIKFALLAAGVSDEDAMAVMLEYLGEAEHQAQVAGADTARTLDCGPVPARLVEHDPACCPPGTDLHRPVDGPGCTPAQVQLDERNCLLHNAKHQPHVWRSLDRIPHQCNGAPAPE
ncbi:hypothetical protein ACIRD9_42640 [Streptomyces violaceus]|uniref:hypothetical protein n=1 Tax=Streptomyces violaceus TaxID=1936 RepID=UPI00382820A0